MSDELLTRATRALRTTTKPNSHGMEAMLVRVSRRRTLWFDRRWRAAAYALAATFVGVGAWARVTGRLPGAFGSAAAPQGSSVPSPQASRASEKRGHGATPVTSPAPPLEPAPIPSAQCLPSPQCVASATLPAPSADAHRVARRSANQALPSVPSASAAASPPTTNVDQLYREAHQAHFVRGDAAAALSAWDRYLAVARPGARMLVEAQYNRAIALARLGRTREALTALQPFANGDYGNYRRDEARALMESLSSQRR